MLTPSEGKEIYERVLAHAEAGHEMTPEDVASLMRAAESGYAPAQTAYANVLGNVEGNLLAALPWYCKAMQQGDKEAGKILRELYATEALVREHVSQYLSVQELIELRKRRVDEGGEDRATTRGSLFGLCFGVALVVAFTCVEGDTLRAIICGAGLALGALAEFLRERFS